MTYRNLYYLLMASFFIGNFLMFSRILNNLTILEGVFYGAFVGFPYATSIFLAGKLMNEQEKSA